MGHREKEMICWLFGHKWEIIYDSGWFKYSFIPGYGRRITKMCKRCKKLAVESLKENDLESENLG